MSKKTRPEKSDRGFYLAPGSASNAGSAVFSAAERSAAGVVSVVSKIFRTFHLAVVPVIAHAAECLINDVGGFMLNQDS